MSLQAHIRFPTEQTEPLAADNIRQAAHQFRVHGTLMLENSFDRELVQTLQSDFIQNYAVMDREAVERTCLKVGLDRYMFTIRLQPPFMNPAVYAAPRVLPVVQELLGADCILQSLGAVCAYPGSVTQHIHRDHPQLFTEAGGLNAFLPPYALH
ncbi:MAG: hypothetical protein ACREB3_15160, partial [Burkholderiales bacterium]